MDIFVSAGIEDGESESVLGHVGPIGPDLSRGDGLDQSTLVACAIAVLQTKGVFRQIAKIDKPQGRRDKGLAAVGSVYDIQRFQSDVHGEVPVEVNLALESKTGQIPRYVERVLKPVIRERVRVSEELGADTQHGPAHQRAGVSEPFMPQSYFCPLGDFILEPQKHPVGIARQGSVGPRLQVAGAHRCRVRARAGQSVEQRGGRRILCAGHMIADKNPLEEKDRRQPRGQIDGHARLSEKSFLTEGRLRKIDVSGADDGPNGIAQPDLALQPGGKKLIARLEIFLACRVEEDAGVFRRCRLYPQRVFVHRPLEGRDVGIPEVRVGVVIARDGKKILSVIDLERDCLGRSVKNCGRFTVEYVAPRRLGLGGDMISEAQNGICPVEEIIVRSCPLQYAGSSYLEGVPEQLDLRSDAEDIVFPGAFLHLVDRDDVDGVGRRIAAVHRLIEENSAVGDIDPVIRIPRKYGRFQHDARIVGRPYFYAYFVAVFHNRCPRQIIIARSSVAPYLILNHALVRPRPKAVQAEEAAVQSHFGTGEAAVVPGEFGLRKIGIVVAVHRITFVFLYFYEFPVGGFGIVFLDARIAVDRKNLVGLQFLEEFVLVRGRIGIIGGRDQIAAENRALGEESQAARGGESVRIALDVPVLIGLVDGICRCSLPVAGYDPVPEKGQELELHHPGIVAGDDSQFPRHGRELGRYFDSRLSVVDSRLIPVTLRIGVRADEPSSVHGERDERTLGHGDTGGIQRLEHYFRLGLAVGKENFGVEIRDNRADAPRQIDVHRLGYRGFAMFSVHEFEGVFALGQWYADIVELGHLVRRVDHLPADRVLRHFFAVHRKPGLGVSGKSDYGRYLVPDPVRLTLDGADKSIERLCIFLIAGIRGRARLRLNQTVHCHQPIDAVRVGECLGNHRNGILSIYAKNIVTDLHVVVGDVPHQYCRAPIECLHIGLRYVLVEAPGVECLCRIGQANPEGILERKHGDGWMAIYVQGFDIDRVQRGLSILCLGEQRRPDDQIRMTKRAGERLVDPDAHLFLVQLVFRRRNRVCQAHTGGLSQCHGLGGQILCDRGEVSLAYFRFLLRNPEIGLVKLTFNQSDKSGIVVSQASDPCLRHQFYAPWECTLIHLDDMGAGLDVLEVVFALTVSDGIGAIFQIDAHSGKAGFAIVGDRVGVQIEKHTPHDGLRIDRQALVDDKPGRRCIRIGSGAGGESAVGVHRVEVLSRVRGRTYQDRI